MISRLRVVGIVAAVAFTLAWKVAPFTTTYAAHGRGLAFWVAAGLLAGVLSATRFIADLRSGWKVPVLCGAAAVGLVVAGFAGRPLTVAVALISIAVLLTRRLDQPSALLGLALGASVGSGFGRVLDLVAAAALVAIVVLLSRKTPAPTSVALLVLLGGAFLWPALPQARADDKVDVPAVKGFVDTHLIVTAGQVVHVQARGVVHFLKDDKAAAADPDGYPARYSGCGGPGFCGVLVGRIDATGAPFLLGASGVVAAPAAGQLQLGVNDYDSADDSGAFAVRVWTTAPGSAPTVALRPGGVVPVPSGVGGALRTALIAALSAGLGALVGGALVRR